MPDVGESTVAVMKMIYSIMESNLQCYNLWQVRSFIEKLNLIIFIGTIDTTCLEISSIQSILTSNADYSNYTCQKFRAGEVKRC